MGRVEHQVSLLGPAWAGPTAQPWKQLSLFNQLNPEAGKATLGHGHRLAALSRWWPGPSLAPASACWASGQAWSLPSDGSRLPTVGRPRLPEALLGAYAGCCTRAPGQCLPSAPRNRPRMGEATQETAHGGLLEQETFNTKRGQRCCAVRSRGAVQKTLSLGTVLVRKAWKGPSPRRGLREGMAEALGWHCLSQSPHRLTGSRSHLPQGRRPRLVGDIPGAAHGQPVVLSQKGHSWAGWVLHTGSVPMWCPHATPRWLCSRSKSNPTRSLGLETEAPGLHCPAGPC